MTDREALYVGVFEWVDVNKTPGNMCVSIFSFGLKTNGRKKKSDAHSISSTLKEKWKIEV